MLRTRKISTYTPSTEHCYQGQRRSITDRLPVITKIDRNLKVRNCKNDSQSEYRKRSLFLPRGTESTKPRFRRHTVQMNVSAANTNTRAPTGNMNNIITIPTLSTDHLIIILRRTLRLVRTLCRVALAIRRYAVNKNDTRGLIDFQDYIKPPSRYNLPTWNKEKDRGNMYFNKHVFSMDSNHTFPSWARRLCELAPENRPEAGLDKLKRYLRGHASFSKFSENIQKELVKNVLYHRYDRKRIILNQGDNAEYFYIMISGTVYVNISHRDANTGVEVTKTVDELKSQCSFGATGLMYNTKRTASVVCDSYVEVLLIDSDTFREYCSEFLMLEHEKQKLFLNSHEVFRSWSERRMKLLSYDVKSQYFRAKKVIDYDLLNSKYVYFVTKGSVDILYNNSEDEHEWLHSEKLNRSVGILGGNRIFAPNSCNIKWVAMQNDNLKDHSIKVLLISNEATVLYIPRSRFEEVAPKNFLATFEFKDEFDYLSPVAYEREKRKAVQWMEYREKMTKQFTKTLKDV